jgi:hypothetical protein
MLLHLGENKAVLFQDIVLILNMDTAFPSPVNEEFLEIAKDERRVVTIADPAKTLVLTRHNERSTLYLSPVSGATLSRRGVEKKAEHEPSF